MAQDTLQILQDKQAITERLLQYGRSMDRMDNELGYSVFHPDARADYGDIFQGTGHEFIEFAYAAHEGMLVHQHQISNILINVDGDSAGSESYVTISFRIQQEDGSLIAMRNQGRYVDRWEKRNGVWRISHRQYIQEIDETWPTEMNYQTHGSRDRNDPGYAVFPPAKSL